jgi:hypothetical protein
VCKRVAGFRFFRDVVEIVEHEKGFLQRGCRDGSELLVVEHVDQWLDVETADHGTEQLRGLGFVDERAVGFSVCDGGEEGSLDLGCIVHAGRHAMSDELQKEIFFTCRRILEQLDQLAGLFRIQGKRRDAKHFALGNVLAIGY